MPLQTRQTISVLRSLEFESRKFDDVVSCIDSAMIPSHPELLAIDNRHGDMMTLLK